MPRVRWVAPALLIPLLAPSPAAAQTPATIAVDDATPTIGQTVNVTTTCPDQGFQSVDGAVVSTPPVTGAATPSLFAGPTSPFTFAVTFNVAGNFTITATCTYAQVTAPPATFDLTVIAEQTPTTAPATTAASVTTDPGQMPATGTSDSAALVAVILLALGAMVLLVAGKFRPLDE